LFGVPAQNNQIVAHAKFAYEAPSIAQLPLVKNL
jgi:hypothetical protein